jgi:hypothetical protein
MSKRVQIAIDCADPARLAAFWADVLGYNPEPPPGGHESWAAFSRTVATVAGEGWNVITDPDGVGPRLLFHSVPEAKTVKNRLHLDVFAAGDRLPVEQSRPLVDAEVARLVGLGAAHVRTDEDERDYYAVMQDPEGNEFCVG